MQASDEKERLRSLNLRVWTGVQPYPHRAQRLTLQAVAEGGQIGVERAESVKYAMKLVITAVAETIVMTVPGKKLA